MLTGSYFCSDKKKADGASEDEPQHKKHKSETSSSSDSMSHRGGGGGSETLSAIGKIEQGKESAIEAEVRAARERAVIPIEIRMKQFRDMLQEKEVSHVTLSRAL